MSLQEKLTSGVKEENNILKQNVDGVGEYNPTNFEFTPISEIIDLDFSDVDSERPSENYMRGLNELSSKLNEITRPVYSQPQVAYNVGGNEGVTNKSFQAFKNYMNNPDYTRPGGPTQPKIIDPILSGSASSGFDRIKVLPAFDELGWSPLRDNEAFYNKNTSAWSEWHRWGPQWLDAAGAGFMSSYRAIGDFFDGDSYWVSPDFQSSLDFAEATRLGSSTRGGFGGFAINFGLQSSYTFGMLGSIAAEELALAAGSAAVSSTGVGAPAGIGAFIVGTGRNFYRSLKTMGNLFDVTRAFKTSKDILQTLRTADKARDFYSVAKTGGKLIGDFFTPELRATLKSFKTAENTAQNLSDMAKVSKSFGSFYRDMRSINFAMSESKLEAGLTYNATLAEAIKLNNGEALTGEELSKANEKALAAATTTLWLNAPVIFATNKLVLGTALGGFSPTLRRIFSKNLPDYAKNIVRSKPFRDATGKLNKGIYKDISGKTILGNMGIPTAIRKFRTLGARRGFTDTAHGILRYSAASIGEGLQEVYQEGVNVGVVNYYANLINNPTARSIDLMDASIKKGVMSQMSGQGAEVFLSGFLMGGLVQGPQRLFFQSIPEIYQRKTNPEAFKEYQKNRENYLKWVNEAGNAFAEDPFDYFNERKLNLFAASEDSKSAERNLFDNDPLGFYDNKDDNNWRIRQTVVGTGTEELYIDQLQSYLDLTDEELIQAFPQHEEDIKSGKARERIKKTIDDIDTYKKKYEKSYDLIVNPYNYNQYKKGTRKYNDERIKHMAVEHARMLYLFAENTFQRALERRDAIEKDLEVSQIVDKISANDLTVLLSSDTIDNEVNLLINEISNLQNAEEKDEKLISAKQKKLTTLLAYKVKLDEIFDQESGAYDRDKASTLKKPLKAYLENIAEENKSFVKEDLLDGLIQNLLDHNNLDRRSQLMSRTVALFSDPNKVLDLVDRLGENFKYIFKNNVNIVKENLKQYANDLESTQLINELELLGVSVDAKQVIDFLNTGDSKKLAKFYTEAGLVTKITSPELWSKINALIDKYNVIKENQKKSEETTEEDSLENVEATDFELENVEAVDETDANLKELKDLLLDEEFVEEMMDAPDLNLKEADQSPYIKEVIKNKYAAYKQDKYNNSEEYKAADEINKWLNTTEGVRLVRGLEDIKKYWHLSLKRQGLSEEELNNTYKTDEGFQKWLFENKNDEYVQSILAFSGIDLIDLELNAPNEGLDSVTDGKPTKTWLEKGPGVNILEVKAFDKTTDTESSLYYITDNKGVPVSAELLNKIGLTEDQNKHAGPQGRLKAFEVWKKLLKVVPQDSAYQYDGLELKYLDEVENNQGDKFIVLGTDLSLDKGAKMRLLPYEFRTLPAGEREVKAFYVDEEGFSETYSKIDISFDDTKISSNATKLNPDSVNGVYAKQFSVVGGQRETAEEADARLSTVLQRLNNADLAGVEISIKRQNRSDGSKLKLSGLPENPYIFDQKDKYWIQIKLNPDTISKVSDLYPQDFDGVIGFIRNDRYRVDSLKQEGVNISELDNNTIERYITPSYIKQDAAEKLRNAFLAQTALTGSLDTLMKDKNEMTMSLPEFTEATKFDFSITPGSYAKYDNTPKSLDDLRYSDYDGNFVIMINERLSDGTKASRFVTNLSGDEEIDFVDKVETELRAYNYGNSNMYDFVFGGSEAYNAIIKNANGVITIVPLKQSGQPEQSTVASFKKLIDKAIETRKINVDANGKEKNRSINDVWNKEEFGKELYIASIPGTRFILEAGPWGNISLTAFHGKKKLAKVNLQYSEVEKLQDKPEGLFDLFEALNKSEGVENFNAESTNKIQITKDSFRTSFSKDASYQDIVDNTVTELGYEVRVNSKIKLEASQDALKEAEKLSVSKKTQTGEDYFKEFVDSGQVAEQVLIDIANKIVAGTPITPEEAAIAAHKMQEIEKLLQDRLSKEDLRTTDETENNLALFSDETYNRFKEENFDNIPVDILTHIANKISQDGVESLSARENEVYNARKGFIQPLVDTDFARAEDNTKPKTLKEEIEDTTQELEQIKAKIEKEHKETGKNRALLKRESKEYQEVFKKLQDLKKQRNNNSAFKVVQDSEQFIEDQKLDSFIAWAKGNLPSFITIADIQELKNRISDNGYTVGQFTMSLERLAGGLTIKGKIYTSPSNKVAYHEAFHAVYRMMLTDEEQLKYQRIAKDELRKKFKTQEAFKQELESFRLRHAKYSELSDRLLEREYIEEYMADEFAKFKTNPRSTRTSSVIKSFFNKLVELIKSVFNRYTTSDLQSLFDKIDSGKFKNGVVQENEYVRSLNAGVTVEAYKAIPFATVEGELITTEEYLDPATADLLMRMISQTYMQRRRSDNEDFRKLSDRELLDNTISDFADLYDPIQDKYTNLSENAFESLEKMYQALTLDDGIRVSEVVEDYMTLFDIQIEEEQDVADETEDNVGPRRVGDYGKEAQQVGGYSSMSKEMRMFIANTTLNLSTTDGYADMFGNKALNTGEELLVPVKYIEAYNGLMLAGMNETNQLAALKKMYFFSRRSKHTKAVVDRFISEAGIDMESLLEQNEMAPEVKDSLLFNRFIKTFMNSRVDYLFHLEDPETNKVLLFSASNRDAANAQIDIWKKQFTDKFEFFSKDATLLKKVKNNLKKISNAFNKEIIDDAELTRIAETYSYSLNESMGISLSPVYIEASISNSVKQKTPYQEGLVSIIGNERILTKEDIDIMLTLLSAQEEVKQNGKVISKAKPQNLFVDGEGTGMTSKLKKIALGNAKFDESIGNTVFKDAEGNLVYAHQEQTYHLVKINDFNDAAFLSNLEKENVYLSNNILLNDPAFMEMASNGMLGLYRLAGTKQDALAETADAENIADVRVSDKGVKYGDLKSIDFIKVLVNLYTAKYNTTSNEVKTIISENEDGVKIEKALAPVLIRIMESSNTGDLIDLAVIKTVIKGSNNEPALTEETIDLFINEVKREYDSIVRNFAEGPQGSDGIVGYNDYESDNPQKGRGFKFFKMKNLLNGVDNKGQDNEVSYALDEELITSARAGLTFDEAIKDLSFDLRSVVNNLAANSFEEFYNISESKNVKYSRLIEGNIDLSNSKIAKAAELLNLTTDKKQNLAQIYFNNWLNTLAINQLMLGEESRLFKDGTDAIKRGKMQNAAGPSAETSIVDRKKGINHTLGDESIGLLTITDPTFPQKFTDESARGLGDRADAQTYITAKGARYLAFSFGELNGSYVELMNSIDSGERIDSNLFWGNSEQQGYLKDNAVINSQKYVFGDGNVFVKTSTIPLTIEYTSINVAAENEEPRYVARKGREKLHNLRLSLEAYERNNPNKIGIAAPLSAVKMLKQKVQTIESIEQAPLNLTQENVTSLDARFFRRQMINPSNKTEITLPNQIKSLITSEQNDEETVLLNGKSTPIGAIRKAYHKMVANGVRFDFDQKVNLLFDNLPYLEKDILSDLEKSKEVDLNLISFIRTAQRNQKSSAASSNMIEFFQDEMGTAKYELNNPITIKKFEQFFLSYFSKKVLAEKVPGYALALKSDYGSSILRRVYSLDENGNIDKQEVLRRNKWERRLVNTEVIDASTEAGMEQLRAALETNPEDGVIVVDRLRVDLPEYIKEGSPLTWKRTGLRYAEATMPSHFEEVSRYIDDTNAEIPDVISKMFIVRIPSQDKHSAMNVKVVDFDPLYMGSTATFPYELIEISGADFDIDKVYGHIKEWYYDRDSRSFREYGEGSNDEQLYKDYVKYSNKKVKQRGTYLNEAYNKYNTAGALTELAGKIAFEDIKESQMDADAFYAAKVLNLPTSLEEYKKYKRDNKKEPYKAPMLNATVDFKFALQGNKKMTEAPQGEVPLAFQPADVLALKAEWENLSSTFESLKELTKEEGISIDNLLGQYYTHKNVKENANLIGSVVPSNVVFNFLKEQGVEILPSFGSIEIVNGEDVKVTYDKFEDFEKGSLEKIRRTQYLISNLISTATDDAKERLLSKLGFVKAAIKNVETMVALGIPLHTATLLVNGKFIRESLENDNGVKLITDKINEIKSSAELIVQPVSVETLKKAIESDIDALSKQEALNLLSLFTKVNDITAFTGKAIGVFNLTTGFGKDFSSLIQRNDQIAELGLNMSDSEFKEYTKIAKVPFDVRAAFGVGLSEEENTPHWIAEYLRINKELNENILPKVFLTSNPKFKDLYKNVLGYTTGRADTNTKDRIYKDLLAFFTIKAYMHQVLTSPEAASVVGGSLSNEFIYPDSKSNFNINTVVADLMSVYKGRRNYFLDYFISNDSAFDKGNTTGLNVVVSNTFASLSDNEKIRIQNGFQELYGQAETRKDAVHILHYIMVKDGFQYTSGSLLDALIPFVMEKYLNASTAAVNAFKNNQDFEKVFGDTYESLAKQFVSNYGESASFINNVVRFNPMKEILNPKDPAGYSQVKNNEQGILTYRQKDPKKHESYSFSRFIKIESFEAPTQYYKLTQATNNGVDVLDNAEGLIKADVVTYEITEAKGSYKQAAIGFMFDNDNYQRPTFRKLKSYILENSDFGNVDVDFDNIAAEEDATSKLAAFANANITATEKGIQYQGVDIEQAKVPEGVEDATSKFLSFVEKPTQQAGEVETSDVQDDFTDLTNLKSEFMELGTESEIEAFYNNELLENDKAMDNMESLGLDVSSAQALKDSFKNSKFTSETEFLEHLRKCYFK